MADYIEGKRPVIEALRAQMPMKCVMLADNLQQDGQVKDILRKARQFNVPVKTVTRRKLDDMSERGSHQGVMAQALPYPYSSFKEILRGAEKHAEEHDGNALIVVLDHITDAGNLGAIARSAEVVGASGVVIPNKRSAHVNAATYKSSAGAIAHLPIAQVANIAQFIDRLKKSGFWVAGASEKAPQCIWDTPMAGKLALVMGNEGTGLARLTQEQCDFLVSLPQAGNIASLNVAQAATACMCQARVQSQN